MLDTNITEVFKYFFMGMLAFVFATIMVVLFEVGTLPSYQNDVEDVIERYGGLTSDALAKLKSDSKKQYGGIFSIDESKSDIGSRDYGTTVNYVIDTKIPNPLQSNVTSSKSIVVSGETVGSAISQIRNSDR